MAKDFVNACRGDYGGMDYKDLMAGVDHVLATYDFIDDEDLRGIRRKLWRIHGKLDHWTYQPLQGGCVSALYQ
ncbi:hypothetical protein RCO48_06680 [Peribacillus frigoritolerans]|nr:hypothetical protein [Peribacillus frigoritolerans]